jgi:hypothetical protein
MRGSSAKTDKNVKSGKMDSNAVASVDVMPAMTGNVMDIDSAFAEIDDDDALPMGNNTNL